jgi:hypothetical protein
LFIKLELILHERRDVVVNRTLLMRLPAGIEGSRP